MEEPHSPNRETDKMIRRSHEFDEKIVTDEMLQEKEMLSKIKDEYLNGMGKFIKHFKRIVRTSNGLNI